MFFFGTRLRQRDAARQQGCVAFHEQFEMDGVGADLVNGALRLMATAVENVDGVAYLQAQDVSGMVSFASGENEMLQVRQIKSVHVPIVGQ